MTVQLHQLRYVVGVAEEGRFTAAAARLRVAQPSVSAAVRALERELGMELFHRSGSRVALTAAGEAFLPWARQALADCEAGRAAVQDIAGLRTGRLSIGATPSLTTGLLAPALAEFHRRHPGVELVLSEGGSGLLVTNLERGQLDLALVILPVDKAWVQTEALIDEALVLAVPADHPLTGKRSVAVTDLDGVPLVMFRDGYDLREVTVAVCRSEGIHPTFAAEGLEMDGVLALAAAGLGAAVVPASVAGAGTGFRTVPFRDDRLRRTIGLASRRDRRPSHAARAMTEHLRKALTTPVGDGRAQRNPAIGAPSVRGANRPGG